MDHLRVTLPLVLTTTAGWIMTQVAEPPSSPWFTCTMSQACCTARCSLCCSSLSPPWLLLRLLELPPIESCFLTLKEKMQIRFSFFKLSFCQISYMFQVTSAKFSQRTLLVIAPMTLVAYILGSLAEYEQNIGLYGSFTTLSGVLGWVGGQASSAGTHHIFPCRLLPPVTSLAMSQSGTLLVRSRGSFVAVGGQRSKMRRRTRSR